MSKFANVDYANFDINSIYKEENTVAYIEGELNLNGYGSNNGGMWGQDGIWAILLLALLGNGFGNRGGYGYGGGAGVIGGDLFGYQLGKVATTNDVASGFNNSAVLSSLNDIKLGQSQMQNFINQGFSGLSGQLIGEFRNVDNAICTLGYQNQQGFNTLAHQISDCCCGTQRLIERSTCDLLNAGNANTQRIIDYLTNEKIESLRAENVALKGRISNDAQSAYLIDKLGYKCPVAAYVVPNPNCCYGACGNTLTGSVIQ